MIEILRKENYSTRKIATLLGVHHATMKREKLKVKRNSS
ncbi:helix-turn-helix domain-containing protein [Fusobacterium necrophorum]